MADAALTASLLELIRRTSAELPEDVVAQVRAGATAEAAGSNAAYAFQVIDDNIKLACDKSSPLCQDTGSILVYIHTPVGYDQLAFAEAMVAAVRQATAKGYLRQNSVDAVSG